MRNWPEIVNDIGDRGGGLQGSWEGFLGAEVVASGLATN